MKKRGLDLHKIFKRETAQLFKRPVYRVNIPSHSNGASKTAMLHVRGKPA